MLYRSPMCPKNGVIPIFPTFLKTLFSAVANPSVRSCRLVPARIKVETSNLIQVHPPSGPGSGAQEGKPYSNFFEVLKNLFDAVF